MRGILFSGSKRASNKELTTMARKDMQWMRVAQYNSVYMGVVDNADRPVFVSDTADIQDMDGHANSGDMSGYWRVWPNFPAFKRVYPNARFDDDGYIWV